MNAAEKRRTPGGDGGSESSTHRRSRRQNQHKPFDGYKVGIPGSRYGRAALQSAVDAILFAPKGFRHAEIFRQGAAMGELVAGGELRDERRVAAALIGAARKLGIADRDAERQILNGLSRGKCNPRRAPEGPGLRDHLDALEQVDTWWTSVQAAEWNGRRGAMALKILRGLHDIAAHSRKVRVAASYRQIAEAAGVGRETVHAYRHRLGGFVRIVSHGNRFEGTPTVWQLVPRVALTDRSETNPVGKARLSEFATTPARDEFDRWPSGWRIHALLDGSESVTGASIARATGLARSTVSRGLRRLEQYGMARRVGAEWVALPVDASLTSLSFERRRRRHEDDRVAWRQWRDARAQIAAGGGQR